MFFSLILVRSLSFSLTFSLSLSFYLFHLLGPGFQPVSDVQDDVSALLWSLLLSVDELSLLFIRRLRSFANWNSSTGTVHTNNGSHVISLLLNYCCPYFIFVLDIRNGTASVD